MSDNLVVQINDDVDRNSVLEITGDDNDHVFEFASASNNSISECGKPHSNTDS